jgi:hypothetical protein
MPEHISPSPHHRTIPPLLAALRGLLLAHRSAFRQESAPSLW